MTSTGSPTFTSGTSGSGTGISTRTDRRSITVRTPALWATLPPVAAAMNAPGSTDRAVTTPESGDRILRVGEQRLRVRSSVACATSSFPFASSTVWGITRSGAFFWASLARR